MIRIAVIAGLTGVFGVAARFAGGLYDLFGEIVAGGGDFYIGGVIAVFAGIVGIPADFGTGGRLCIVMDEIVSRRFDFHVGGVIAVFAGIVGVPADFGAGGRFGIMMDEIVTRRFDFYIAGIIAVFAGIVGVPADFGAGGRFGFVTDEIMTGGGDFFRFRFAAFGTGIDFFARLRAGGIQRYRAIIPFVVVYSIRSIATGALFPVIVIIILPDEEIVVIRVRTVPCISERVSFTCVVAEATGFVVYGRRYAVGFGLEIFRHMVVYDHVTTFRASAPIAVDAGFPVTGIIVGPGIRECMTAVIRSAAGAAGSRRDAGCIAAGAAAGIGRAAAGALAGAGVRAAAV